MPPLAHLLAALLLAEHAAAFWRMEFQHGAALVTQRADPLTNPGAISGHAHSVAGGSNFNLDLDYETARKGACTSAVVKQDMSNYWTPTLWFWWANGSFTSVEQNGLLVYYLPRFHPSDKTKVTAFPPDFRMLTGNPYKRSYNGSSLMDKAIGINCLGGSDAPTRRPEFPAVNCPNGMRLEIMFPSCWDGEHVDSPNHQSHVAYPDDNEAGPCPAGFDTRIETLFYEVWYSVDPFKDSWGDAMNTSQPFVLSVGDPTGYALHGDFLNGWDVDVLQRAIDECTADSGVVHECGVFEFYDYDKPENYCLQTPAIDETVVGTLDKLPGCNPVDYGPGDVTVCSENDPPALLSQITVYGALAGGNQTLKVATSSSGNTSGGTGGGTGGGGEKSSTSSAGGSTSRSSPPSGTSKPSTSPSSAVASDSSSSSPLGNGKLVWGLLFLGFTVLTLAIIWTCTCGPCGSSRQKTLADNADEEAGEKRGLRSSSDSDTDSDSDDGGRHRRRA